jgi:hypothetical protein
MMKTAGPLLILLATFARPLLGAEPPAAPSSAALAEAMRQARYSDGFEARMNISTVKADGRRLASFKLAVIGQFDAARQRLLIRGISPDKVRHRFLAAERSADGRIRSIEYGEPISAGIAEADPFAKLFESGPVIWDMFAPWWNWPKQSLGTTEQIAGRDCTIVRSQSDAAISPIREVISCVDKDAGLSLRTQLFDSRRALVRTITVEQTMRKESGTMAAKRMSITGADNSVTEVEVYGGDEHYAIAAGTFAPLGPQPAAGQ